MRKRNLGQFLNSSKGFTLIELMIVIAIIAVLAAILFPSFVRARAQSQLAGCESNERNLATALNMYAADNQGQYPSAVGNGLPSPAGVWGNYVGVNPVCPTNRSAYVYAVGSSFTVFTISQGPAGGTPHAVVDVPSDYPQYWSFQGLIP